MLSLLFPLSWPIEADTRVGLAARAALLGAVNVALWFALIVFVAMAVHVGWRLGS